MHHLMWACTNSALAFEAWRRACRTEQMCTICQAAVFKSHFIVQEGLNQGLAASGNKKRTLGQGMVSLRWAFSGMFTAAGLTTSASEF